MLLRRFLFVFMCAAAIGSATLFAQPAPPVIDCTNYGSSGPECAVGSSYSYDLGAFLQQAVSQVAASDNVVVTFSFAVTGGSLPPGITLSPSGLFSGTFEQEGSYSTTITITLKIIIPGEPPFEFSAPAPLDFTVAQYQGPPLAIDPSELTFNLTQGAAATTKSVTITNHGSSTLQVAASATTSSGGTWLSASSSGPAPATGATTVSITADPSQLSPGTYSGSVSISAGSQSFTVSVLAVVTGNQPDLALSQTGLFFEAVVGGAATSPQQITVLNSGAGNLSYSASASTISGGSWLSVSSASGTASASNPGNASVSVNPSGLQAGTYYGKVSFAASGAADSPQVASVVLNVVPPANSPGGFVKPTGLIFIGAAGGTNPAARTISITNPSPIASTYLVTPFGDDNISWLSATPTSGSVSSTQSATVSVQPNLQGVSPGVHFGDLTVAFVPPATSGSTSTTSSGQVLHVEVVLIVLQPGSLNFVEGAKPRITSGCTPSQLIPVFTLLGAGFSATAGWPTAIETTVIDDCGNPLQAGNGSVTVNFSSGDPALSLSSIGNGSWTATWNSSKAAPGVTLTAQAQQVQPALNGHASIGGVLAANAAVPSVATGGVVSAANFAVNQPLAPGSFGAIFGSNLADSLAGSSQFPLSTQLGGTSVYLGGEQLPLLFASTGQVNVIMPYDVAVNSSQQLIVQRDSAISIPQSVVIAPAVPAVFTQNGAGTGAALYNAYKSDGTPLANNSAVSAGYIIVLYCSGLGAVNPPVPAGSQAPTATLSNTVAPVTATVGGQSAKVDFSGLAPGFAGLYQVNLEIPSGLPSGSATVTLSVNGQESAPVTITIQ